MKVSEIIVLIIVAICGIIAFWFLVQGEGQSGLAVSSGYQYDQGQKGIVYTTDPFLEIPGVPDIRLLSNRFPAFILLDSLGLYDIGKCKSDLWASAGIATPQSAFSCYNTPLGQYIRIEPVDPWGRTRFKGNVFCYKRYSGAEAQDIDAEAEMSDLIMKRLVDPAEQSWTKVRITNSEGVSRMVPVCA